MVIRLFTGTALGTAALIGMALDQRPPSPPAAPPAALVAPHPSPLAPSVPTPAARSRRDGHPSLATVKVGQP